jgi:proteasome lid subunit RPN8/RPN11
VNRNQIQLPRKLASKLLHLAQQSPSQEICGLISLKNGTLQTCYPITNVATEPQNRFLLDEKEQIHALKTMRAKGEELFAIYHSHPTAAAYPSTLDLEMANYDNALYFIISLNVKGILELRAFQIENKHATEIVITL